MAYLIGMVKKSDLGTDDCHPKKTELLLKKNGVAIKKFYINFLSRQPESPAAERRS